MPLLSIIIPCYNEGATLRPFTQALLEVVATLQGMQTEILFVDDGSEDDTLATIKELASHHPQLGYISFSRNFGKESAILAGLEAARGEYTAVMDADLQDPPSLLPSMLRAVQEEGYDCAGSRRVTRKGEPIIRSFFARCFYHFINRIADIQLVDGARDFRLFSRRARLSIISMPEYNRFSKGLYEWIGFRTKWFEFENIRRAAGETKWSFWKLFKYSVEGIVAFSTSPLVMVALLGLAFMCISLAAITLLAARQLIFHSSVDGWTSLICIMLLISGIQLFCLGIFGQYMAKMYLEVKHRPHYLIAESFRVQEEQESPATSPLASHR